MTIEFIGKKGKGSPYSITERRVPGLIPVLGSQTASDVSHKPGGRLPLLSARTEQRHDGCEQCAQDCYPTAAIRAQALLCPSPAR